MNNKINIGFIKDAKKVTFKHTFNIPFSSFWLIRNENQYSDLFGSDLINNGLFINRTKDKTLKDVLLNLVTKAKEIIIISSFLLLEEDLAEKLMEAAKRGVRIYVLSSPEQTIDKEEDYVLEDEKSIKQKTKDFYKKIIRLIFLRTAQYFHAKFLVIDPFTPQAKGILTTANFNKALTDKIEIGVLLNKEQIKGAYNFFVYGFWLKAERELINITTGDLMPVKDISPSIEKLIPKKIEGVFLTLPPIKGQKKDGIVYERLEDKVLELLSIKNIEKMYVSSFGYEENQFLRKILEISNNTEIVLFTPKREAQFKVLSKILEQNSSVRIIGHPLLHAKFIVLKTRNNEYYGIITTANFQQKGLKEGFEIGVSLSNVQAKALFNHCGVWEEKFPLELSTPSLVNNNLTKLPKEFNILVEKQKERFKEVRIVKFEKKSKNIELKSLDEEIKVPSKDALLEQFRMESSIPLSLEYTYNIIPPVISFNKTKDIVIDKERSEEEKVTIFRIKNKGGKTFIGVKNLKEFNIAKRLKKEKSNFKKASIVIIE